MEEKKEVEDSTEAAEAASEPEKVMDIVEELLEWKTDVMNVTLHDYANRLKAAHEREKAAFDEAVASWKEHYELLDKEHVRLQLDHQMLCATIDLFRATPVRHACTDIYVEPRLWGLLPEMAIILRQKSNRERGAYLCELMLSDRPIRPMAYSIATDIVLGVLRFGVPDGATKGGGHA